MSERDWLNRVLVLAQRFGWLRWHVAAPMRADGRGGFVGDARAAGLPDLVLIHQDPPRMILAELKGSGGRVSDAQREFLTAAREVAEIAQDVSVIGPKAEHALGVYCWYPEDEPIVEQILRARRLA